MIANKKIGIVRAASIVRLPSGVIEMTEDALFEKSLLCFSLTLGKIK
ncbi:MAG: hypothetical protein ACI4AA_09165 [Lachnospiraceae bacterium]